MASSSVTFEDERWPEGSAVEFSGVTHAVVSWANDLEGETLCGSKAWLIVPSTRTARINEGIVPATAPVDCMSCIAALVQS